MNLLTCDKFNISINNKSYSSSGFKIECGKFYHLCALSGFCASNILYLFSGLHIVRNLTRPGNNNHLERIPIGISKKDLYFIKIGDHYLYDLNQIERSKLIGTIHENPDIAILGRTVLEDYSFNFMNIDKQYSSSDLMKYGLFEIMNRETEKLSGGERHRLICANAFEKCPRILIGDFSSSNLDIQFKYDFLSWINNFIRNGGSALIHGLSVDELSSFDIPINYLTASENGQIIECPPNSELYPSCDESRQRLQNLLEYRIHGDSILKVNNVFLNNITKPISFEIMQREIIIIEGNNGCGKTTLGKIIAGRIKRYKGKVTFCVKKLFPFMALQFPERSFIRDKVIDEISDLTILNICGITKDEVNEHPLNLSRGKQKLLNIALTMKLSKGLCILDEPTTGMDFEHKKRFIYLLNHFKDHAVIIFNHDPSISNLSKTINF